MPNHGLSRCWGALLYDSSIPGSWAYLFSVGIDPKVHGERRTQRGALWGGGNQRPGGVGHDLERS